MKLLLIFILLISLNQGLEFDRESQNNEFQGKLECISCKTLFGSIQNTNLTDFILKFDEFAFNICKNYHITALVVCKGAVDEMAPLIIQNLFLHYTDPRRICYLLEICPKYYEEIDINNLTQSIVANKPNLTRPVPTGLKNFSILHLTDVHTDDYYLEGTNEICDQPLCCRANTNASNQTAFYSAGHWGSLASCDLPPRTAEQMRNQIVSMMSENASLNLKLGIWTGDNTPHDIWNQTKDKNMQNTIDLTNLFKTIPNLTFVPVMGNHEPYPVNQYDFNGTSFAYIRDTFSDIWTSWIGQQAAQQHRQLGYYQVEYQDLNLKILAINTQACNYGNWFFLKDPTDPGNMLVWMQKELDDSEAKNQSVWIIGHIPTNNCLQDWARVYTALIDRYEYTIRAQFVGHTHTDSFEVFTSINNQSQAVGALFVAPSLTTYSNHNPSFRIFTIDEETLIPINYDQYRLNLSYWNSQYPQKKNITWDIAYSMVQEYNLTNLYDYSNLQNLQTQIKTNLTINKIFFNNFYSGNPSSPLTEINLKIYCETLPLPYQASECKGSQITLNTIVGTLQGPWFKSP